MFYTKCSKIFKCLHNSKNCTWGLTMAFSRKFHSIWEILINVFFLLLIHKQQTGRILDSEVLNYEKELFWNSVWLREKLSYVKLWKWSFWWIFVENDLCREWRIYHFLSGLFIWQIDIVAPAPNMQHIFRRNNIEQNEMQT